jgi:sec-independent protein translocase protein TatA
MGDGLFSGWHLLILAGVFVLLFGAKRLPDGARHLGKAMRIFKTEIKGLNEDGAGTPPAQIAGSLPADATPPVASALSADAARPPAATGADRPDAH